MGRVFDRDVMVELFVKGLEVDEVAAFVGCSPTLVRQAIAEAGLMMRRAWTKRMERWSSVNWSEVIEDYEGVELSVRQVCIKHGLYVHDLYQFLALRPDIKKRAARGFRWAVLRADGRNPYGAVARRLPDPAYDAPCRMYADRAMMVREIVQMFGISHSKLMDEVDLRGIPHRHTKRHAPRRLRNE